MVVIMNFLSFTQSLPLVRKGEFWGFSRLPAVWKRFVLLFFERVAKRGWEEEGGSVTRVTSNPSSKPFSADGPAKEALPGSLVSSCLHCYFYHSSLWSSFVYLQYLPTCNYLNRVLPNKLNVVHSKHNLERMVSNVQCFSKGPKCTISAKLIIVLIVIMIITTTMTRRTVEAIWPQWWPHPNSVLPTPTNRPIFPSSFPWCSSWWWWWLWWKTATWPQFETNLSTFSDGQHSSISGVWNHLYDPLTSPKHNSFGIFMGFWTIFR